VTCRCANLQVSVCFSADFNFTGSFFIRIYTLLNIKETRSYEQYLKNVQCTEVYSCVSRNCSSIGSPEVALVNWRILPLVLKDIDLQCGPSPGVPIACIKVVLL
jgi:hypothetical protein